ncbi:hypothetical protein [Sandarakinorhabdus cyanobacteriorum]|uniref:hypothetical protein n=1 Tax=Sandarakinorhabdus cyanobacteriorum TaxID=1981098 RepID=UPI00105497A3|nr:hypothetical protein [Sandarakinorhabdus cyanobacteriorum]
MISAKNFIPIVMGLTLAGCASFIDAMAEMRPINVDQNRINVVPQYPDVTKTNYVGGEDCSGYVRYGRQNNNTFAQIYNTSERSFDYKMYWDDGTTSTGTLSPGAESTRHF